MKIASLVFDVDGTLLDTTSAHTQAWRRAFAAFGHSIDTDLIAREIGKGGDKLVPALAGERVERQDGTALRERYAMEFLRIAASSHLAPFPGVAELIAALRDRGLKSALATSARREHLDAMQESAGLDLGALVDEVVTASDAEESKPEPDILLAAAAKLRLAPESCAMVGDTPHDAEAASRGGLVFLGVTGGVWDAGELRRAGAAGVWRNPADLLAHLYEGLTLAARAAATMATAREG